MNTLVVPDTLLTEAVDSSRVLRLYGLYNTDEAYKYINEANYELFLPILKQLPAEEEASLTLNEDRVLRTLSDKWPKQSAVYAGFDIQLDYPYLKFRVSGKTPQKRTSPFSHNFVHLTYYPIGDYKNRTGTRQIRHSNYTQGPQAREQIIERYHQKQSEKTLRTICARTSDAETAHYLYSAATNSYPAPYAYLLAGPVLDYFNELSASLYYTTLASARKALRVAAKALKEKTLVQTNNSLLVPEPAIFEYNPVYTSWADGEFFFDCKHVKVDKDGWVYFPISDIEINIKFYLDSIWVGKSKHGPTLKIDYAVDLEIRQKALGMYVSPKKSPPISARGKFIPVL